MSDLVSIIVPTRRRPDTVVKSIATALGQRYRNVEVIVSNNGQDPETERVVGAIRDDRMRLVAPPAELSMSRHFEFAIQHARGEWIAVIGDDDGVLPDGIERGVAALHESGLEALASCKIRYAWPGLRNTTSEPLLSIPLGRGWVVRKAAKAMHELLDRRVGFSHLPMAYTGGMFSRRLYDRITERRGSFFQSQIPDIYSCFAFCSAIDSFVLHSRPLFVAGTSRHSTGFAMSSGAVPAYALEANLPLHADLCLDGVGDLGFSFHAIIYETYLQSAYLRHGRNNLALRDALVAVLHSASLERGRGSKFDGKIAKTVRWCEGVAERHGLDRRWIASKARHVPLRRRLGHIRFRAEHLLTDVVIDPAFGKPLNDVYDAVNTAAYFLEHRPSQLRSLQHTAMRTIRRRLASRRDTPSQ